MSEKIKAVSGVTFFSVSLLLILCLNSFGQNGSLANNYCANGNLQIVSKLSSSDTGTVTTVKFFIEVFQDTYKIKVSSNNQENNYREYYFDGKKLAALHHITNVVSKNEVQNPQISNLTNLFPVIIDNRQIPQCDGSRSQFVWLAFASAGFFFSLTNSIMPPIWSPEDPAIRRQPFDMIISYAMSKGAPFVPDFIAFINDGYYRSYNPATGNNDVIKLAPPYDVGFTNAFYKVLDYTNKSSYKIPSKFIFLVFSTPINVNRPPFERLVIHGALDNIKVDQTHKISPSTFNGIASVSDFSLLANSGTQIENDNNFVSYPTTNSSFINSNQLAQIRANAEKVIVLQAKVDKETKLISGQRKKYFFTVIIVINAMLFYIFLKTKLKIKN